MWTFRALYRHSLFQVFTTTTQETFSHNRPMTMMTSEMPPAYTSRPGTQMGMERPGTMMNMTRPGTMETGMGSQHGAGGWVSQPHPGMTSSEENRTSSSSTTSDFRTRTETPMHPPTWANKGTTKPSTLGNTNYGLPKSRDIFHNQRFFISDNLLITIQLHLYVLYSNEAVLVRHPL